MPPGSHKASGALQQPLEELEEVTKAAVDKGKQNVTKAVHSLGGVAKAVTAVVAEAEGKLSERSDRGRPRNGGGGSAENVGGENGSTKGQSSNLSAASTSEGAPAPRLPSISEDEQAVEQSPPTESAGEPQVEPGALQDDSIQPVQSSATPAVAPSDSASTGLGINPAVLLIYTAILSAYQAWSNENILLSNQVPLSAVFPLILVAFLLGYNLDGILSRRGVKHIDQRGRRKTPRRQKGTRKIATPDDALQTPGSSWDEEDSVDENAVFMPRARALVRRGRNNIKRRFGRRYANRTSRNNGEVGGGAMGLSHALKNNRMFSTLAVKEKDREWERKLKAPFGEGLLMDHLLKYKDFARHKTERRVAAITAEGAAESKKGGEPSKVRPEGERSGSADIAIGQAPLQNTRAESLETDEKFAHVVDPMCELRGMDLFLTDDPEEDIWSQPLLNQCGLRDTPTLVCNLMMPFGNMTAYFKLPDWFDDWDNIPAEMDDDPPDVKALKRFLLGTEEYRKARAKVIPFVVDGPLAIRLIKPAPMEVDIDGPRHPNTWTNVPKRVDPVTGKVQCAVLELDVDLFSERAVRKIINIVRPHLQKITIDVAVIISKPEHSEAEEPSACLGLWRIEKVDFEQAAVFPESSVEEAAEKVKMIFSQMEGVAAEETGVSGRRPGILVAA